MLDSLLPSPSLRASLTARAEKYAQNVDLLASYLIGRGLGHAAATGHLLGCVVDPEPGDERFAGMMSIPYLTAHGDVIALKLRRIDGSEGPKYDSPSGQKAHLFNARALAAGGELALVVEGELDAVMGSSVLGVPTVGTPGTNFLDHWTRCFGDFDRVVVVADHDLTREDGGNPGLKHAKKVQQLIAGAELVLPPSGEDLSSWVQNHGVEAVRDALSL